MSNMIDKFKIKENSIFYFTYTLLLICSIMSNVKFLMSFIPYIKYFAFGLMILFFVIRIKKMSLKIIIISLIIITVLMVSYIITGDNNILLLYLLILIYPGEDFEKFIKKDIIIRVVLCTIVIILYNMDLTNNYFMYRPDGRIRSSMGFAHPNNFGMYMFTICADYVYLNYQKFKIKNYLVILIMALLIYFVSNSRTSVIGLLLLLVLIFLSQKLKIKYLYNNFFKFIIINLPIIFIALTLIFVNLYNNHNEFVIKVNEILSNRIFYASSFLNEYDINLLGNKINYISTQEAKLISERASVLDNSYLSLVLNYGILTFIIIYYLLRKIINTAYEKKDGAMLSIITVYVLICMIESILYKYQFDIYIMYFALYLHQYSKKLGDNYK